MPEIDELIETLNNRTIDSVQRRAAIRNLARLGGEKTVEALIGVLTDEERSIRNVAASTLGRLGDQKAVEPLIKTLQDEDNYVRKNAAAALGRLGDKRAIEPLRQLISDMFITVRTTAKESLLLLTGGEEAQSTSKVEKPSDEARRLAAHGRANQEDVLEPPARHADGEPPPDYDEEEDTVEDEDKTVLDVLAEDESTPPELTDESVVPDKEETPEPEVQDPTEAIDLPEKGTEREMPEESSAEDALTVIETGVETPAYDEDSEQLPHYVPGERMQFFFQEAIEPVKNIYQQLSAKQKLLLEIESEIKAGIEKLTSEQSTKDDSLIKYNDTSRRMEKHIEVMQAEYESTLLERAEVGERLASRFHTFVAAILRKKNEGQERLAQLDARIVELKQRIEEGGRKLEEHRKEYDGLSATADNAQAGPEELEKRRKSCEAEISSLNGKIEDNIIAVIQSASFVEFERKIEKLADKTDDIEFFRTCATRLRDRLIERNHVLERTESASTALAAAQEQAQNSLNGICGAIADGFYTTSTPKKANAKISGSITFKEVETPFDISGVTGSVSGSGAGTANYALDEPAWNATQELQKQVEKMTEAWASLGAATGDFELYSAKQNVLKIGVSEYAHFMRVELEKDFYDK